MTEIYLVSAARTAIGSFGGSLKDQTPGTLGTVPVRAVVERAGVDPGEVGHVVLGTVIPTHPRDAYASRIAAMGAGIPEQTPAMNVNRLCGSGLQAIVSAAQSIMLGDCDIAIGGGVEVMSAAPFYATSVRWGHRLGDAVLVDGLNGALTDPFNDVLMGVTAENVAARYAITRADQDALALESQRRAARAISDGHFRDQIVPVELKSRRGVMSFDVDEYVRLDACAEDFEKLRPIFQRTDGTVTAGNSSGINDGAAAVLLANAATVKRLGLSPLARLVSYRHAGVDPAFMGIGPIPATRKALEKAGIAASSLDVIESNEAFAAQACAVARELDFDPEKVNPNGGAIALGHPVGATGAVIATKLAYELQRTGGRYGLTTMCIGGGQGIAIVWERA